MKWKKVGRIINILQVNRNDPGWKSSKDGLFEYPKSDEDIRSAINPFFTVAEGDDGIGGIDGILGYCLAYDSNFFRTNFGNIENLEWKSILDGPDKNYLYIDQLGVLKSWSLGAGRTANLLTDHAIISAREAGLQKILTYVCVEPLLNLKSVNFVEKKGFQRRGEISIENDVVLRSYELEL